MLKFGLSKNYFDVLRDDVLPEGGAAMAGGAAGGLVFGFLQNTKMFQELLVKDETDPAKLANKEMAKKLGLAALLGIGGGSGLWMGGEIGINAAKGLMGAMGATMAAVVWNKMAAGSEKMNPYALSGVRVYQDQLPAGIANVNVSRARDYDRSPVPNLMAVLGA